MTFLEESEWRSRIEKHAARVDQWLLPRSDRASRGEKHPVFDFLFTYYPFRPSQLRAWSPGVGVRLGGSRATEFLRRKFFEQNSYGVEAHARRLSATRLEGIRWIANLLAITRSRPPSFNCFGLHEWAMLYRAQPSEIRHSVPLRFDITKISEFVEASNLCCTHFDAFRHFTDAAVSLNVTQLSRPSVPDYEQAGCLHSNMDLYKWAMKLSPFVESEIVAECFELAADIREIDMRASPYDLRSLGFEPLKIETPEGRAEYAVCQRRFAERSTPIRAALEDVCRKILRQVAETKISTDQHFSPAINAS